MDSLNDLLTQAGLGFLAPYSLWLLVALAALLGLVFLKFVLGGNRRPKRGPASDAALQEDLGTYPPAPGLPGPRRLTVESVPARVRLVVLAPVGKDMNVNVEGAGALLDQLVRGLGVILEEDRPRIQIWPAQLSNRGFAPTFHRLVSRPEPEGQLSHWVLAAGPAKAGRWPLLVGLALWTDTPTTLGRLILEPHQWRDTLRIQTLES